MICRIALVLLLAVVVMPLSVAQTTNPRLQSGDMTYLGYITFDNLNHGATWLGYGGRGLSFYQDPTHGKTLFIGGNLSSSGETIAQVKIPASLSAEGTFVQNFVNTSFGDISSGSCSGNPQYTYGSLVHNGRLLIANACQYGGSQTASIGALNGTNLSGATFSGWKAITGTANARAKAGAMASIPAEWQSLFGGEALIGNCCISVIGTNSAGPAFTVIDPDEVGVTTPVPGTTVAFFPTPNELCGTGPACSSTWGVTANADYNYTMEYGGVVFPAGTRSVLAFVGMGTGCYWYGGLTNASDGSHPCSGAANGNVDHDRDSVTSGPHAPPYKLRVLAFDANDLLAVKAGTMQTYEIRPYATWDLPYQPSYDSTASIKGATLDPVTNRLYLTTNYGANPRVEVFQINAPAASTYTVTPSAGSNGSISPNTPQTINSGSTTQFTVTPNSGYTASVGGTCGGSLVGTTYTTNAVTANCTVTATFSDTTAPTAPATLTATAASNTQINLSWAASTDNVGIVGYSIERCAGVSCTSWAEIQSTTGTGTTYNNTGLTPDTTYRYRVRARDATPNYSGYSPIASAVTTITYTVTGTAGSNGTVSPASQTVNSGSTATLTVTPNAGYTASASGCGGSLAGTTYTTAAVTANCTVTATFSDTTAPTTPTDMDARSNSTSTVDLSWQPSTDAVGVTSYRVDYCSGFGCSSWATLGTSATNAYTHTGITPAANPTIYRYRVYALDAANNLSGAATSIYFNAVPTIPAFPGAEGGGATSKGGRGGTVYHVTSLDGGTGAGTLRACVAASGPRTCVFDVAGNIELTGNINISLPYITIAGHTAPGGGITISGKNSTQVSLTVRTHNVTIRGIRIRKGYNAGTPDQDGDSVNVLSASATASPVGPVILDHVSISWGQDENAGAWALTTRAPKNITYQWAMIYEPLLAHPVNFMTGAYNNATAERMTDIDVHHSLFANSSHRNPLIKNKTFRFVGNVVYNTGDWMTAVEGTVQADLIGNRYKTGPLYQTISPKAYEIELNPAGDASTPTLGSPSLYVVGNVGPHNADPLADNWGMTRLIDIPINAGVELGPLSESYRRFTPLSALPFPITAQDVWTAETLVLAGAGASRRLDCTGNLVSNRDSADARVVAQYTAGNVGIIPINEDAVGGYPTLAAGTACTDTDGDGMPDAWETANGLNPASAADGQTLHASGYSNLERYLAGSADTTPPVASDAQPTNRIATGATSATLRVTTNEAADCRYSATSGFAWGAGTPYSTTGGTAHSSPVTVAGGRNYRYYSRCLDPTGNQSAEVMSAFFVPRKPMHKVW